MKYIIGVDCGGTKTEAVAYTINGDLIDKKVTGFGNLLVDYSTGLKNIKDSIEYLMQKYNKKNCHCLVLGIAGIDSGGIKDLLLQNLMYDDVPVYLMNDGQLAHYSLLQGSDGIIIIAGTGSVGIGRKGNNWYRVGGWGHLLGDEGSAYDIAKKGIQQVLYEYDNNNNNSELSKTVLEFYQIQNAIELSQKFYSLKKGEIAELAQIIGDLGEYDKQAQEILENSGMDLAQIVVSLIKKMDLKDTDIKIGLNGSVLENNQIVQNSFLSELEKQSFKIKIYNKVHSCSKGAYYFYKGLNE